MTRFARLIPMMLLFGFILGLLAGAVWLLNALEVSFASRV